MEKHHWPPVYQPSKVSANPVQLKTSAPSAIPSTAQIKPPGATIQRQQAIEDEKLLDALRPFELDEAEFADDYFDDEIEKDEEDEALGGVAGLFAQDDAVQARMLPGNPIQMMRLPQTGYVYVGSHKLRVAPKGFKRRGISTHAHGGRTYYYETEPAGTGQRVTRYEGPLSNVQGGRVATKKTAYKRKNDHNAHLIAHSFGGSAQFTHNYVAMSSAINARGGDWYRMEAYIRSRLRASGSKVYMVVRPTYAGVSRRPHQIKVSVYFNRKPYKVGFVIHTP